MRLPISLLINLDLDLFELEEVAKAAATARQANGDLYSWKTSCRSNWLERGLSICDVLGIVVLPKGLPDVIDLPDDPREVGD